MSEWETSFLSFTSRGSHDEMREKFYSFPQHFFCLHSEKANGNPSNMLSLALIFCRTQLPVLLAEVVQDNSSHNSTSYSLLSSFLLCYLCTINSINVFRIIYLCSLACLHEYETLNYWQYGAGRDKNREERLDINARVEISELCASCVRNWK
jgi:hypothetical protein